MQQLILIVGWTLSIMYLILPFLVLAILVRMHDQQKKLDFMMNELSKVNSELDKTNQILLAAHDIRLEEES